jgi:hypothetical protein
VDAAVEPLGFRPSLELVGPIDSAVPHEVRPDLLAVVQEALSNVVRHAQARTAHVTVAVGDSRVTVTVRDDGVGAADAVERGGQHRSLQQLVQAPADDLVVVEQEDTDHAYFVLPAPPDQQGKVLCPPKRPRQAGLPTRVGTSGPAARRPARAR